MSLPHLREPSTSRRGIGCDLTHAIAEEPAKLSGSVLSKVGLPMLLFLPEHSHLIHLEGT